MCRGEQEMGGQTTTGWSPSAEFIDYRNHYSGLSLTRMTLLVEMRSRRCSIFRHDVRNELRNLMPLGLQWSRQRVREMIESAGATLPYDRRLYPLATRDDSKAIGNDDDTQTSFAYRDHGTVHCPVKGGRRAKLVRAKTIDRVGIAPNLAGRTRTYPKSRESNQKCGFCTHAGSKTGSKFSTPAELQEVIDAWAQLPRAVTAGIVAMIRASKT